MWSSPVPRGLVLPCSQQFFPPLTTTSSWTCVARLLSCVRLRFNSSPFVVYCFTPAYSLLTHYSLEDSVLNSILLLNTVDRQRVSTVLVSDPHSKCPSHEVLHTAPIADDPRGLTLNTFTFNTELSHPFLPYI